jgi:hypothetical protein
MVRNTASCAFLVEGSIVSSYSQLMFTMRAQIAMFTTWRPNVPTTAMCKDSPTGEVAVSRCRPALVPEHRLILPSDHQPTNIHGTTTVVGDRTCTETDPQVYNITLTSTSCRIPGIYPAHEITFAKPCISYAIHTGLSIDVGLRRFFLIKLKP